MLITCDDNDNAHTVRFASQNWFFGRPPDAGRAIAANADSYIFIVSKCNVMYIYVYIYIDPCYEDI